MGRPSSERRECILISMAFMASMPQIACEPSKLITFFVLAKYSRSSPFLALDRTKPFAPLSRLRAPPPHLITASQALELIIRRSLTDARAKPAPQLGERAKRPRR